MAMVRPRGGDFVYTDAERDMMRLDARLARAFGVTGVVFGCLTATRMRATGSMTPSAPSSWRWPRSRSRRRTRSSREPATEPVAVTFHMAFGRARRRRAAARDRRPGGPWGGAHPHPRRRAGTPISANYARLRELIAYADGRLTILPGAGITYENVDEVARELGVAECHGTKIVRIG